jgi:hypothetical protein
MGDRITSLQIHKIVGAVAIGALILASSSIAGANQFGSRSWNAGLTYGNISSIAEPTSANQPADPNVMWVHRSGEAYFGSAGQIQVAWISVGFNISVDNCGTTNSSTWTFLEYQTTAGVYTCKFFAGYNAPQDVNFNVFVNSTGWNDKIAGSLDPSGPYHLGFATGFGFIGGESFFLSGHSNISSTCYGEGPSAWDYYPAPNNGGGGSVLVTPNSSTTPLTTGNWSIGTAPTPLCDNYS